MSEEQNAENAEFEQWECVVCGFIYDEEFGLPRKGIPPGTRWNQIPDEWECPECGTSKLEFEPAPIDD